MCTLVLLQRKGELVAVSANRNEMLSRPSSGPQVQGGILAPRDEAAHGTWLGLNRHGLFVCVTNRAGAMIDPSRRSRGLLVLEALQAQSARGLHTALAELRGDRHNGFHLIYADVEDAFVTWSDGVALRQLALPAGQVHVVTERSFGAKQLQRGDVQPANAESADVVVPQAAPLGAPALESDSAEAAVPPAGQREREVRAAFAQGELSVTAWRKPMTLHAAEPLESACVHADAVGYGTRSSLQLIVRRGGGEALWTNGHPCVNAPRDISPLVAALRA